MSKTIIKERPIGTVFEWHGTILKVVENKSLACPCKICHFYERCIGHVNNRHLHFKGQTKCITLTRKDRKNIHYEKLSND